MKGCAQSYLVEPFQSEIQLLQMFLELSYFGVFDDDHLAQLVGAFPQHAQLQIHVLQLPLQLLRLLIALQCPQTTTRWQESRGGLDFLVYTYGLFHVILFKTMLYLIINIAGSLPWSLELIPTPFDVS